MRSWLIGASVASGLALSSCTTNDITEYRTLTNPSGLGIVRRPQPRDTGETPLAALPSYDPNSTDSLQIDLRSRDLSGLDLSERGSDLSYSVFDTKTVWPTTLPPDFSPFEVMETGKNPGLGVRALHARGVTGKGIGIAIIDQPLLVDHAEYADRVKCYEEIHWPAGDVNASMHGPAVASFAVGKTVGVAPEADLYFIAEQHGTYSGSTFDWDFTWLAQAIDRVLQIDAQLTAEDKIRVISISVGWAPTQKGYAEVTAAVDRAVQAGIFVVSSALSDTYGYQFHGLGRSPMADPDQPESHEPGTWWAKRFYAQPNILGDAVLLAPMDSRTGASYAGNNDYFWGRSGGWSWTIPYLAGVYALACQVKPDISPEIFWTAALSTATTITLTNAGNVYPFGKIINPAQLVDALSK